MKVTKEEDFSSAMAEGLSEMCDEYTEHIKILPVLKVNSNDLNWLKEQKPSRGSSLTIQSLQGDAVRTSAHTKKSTFSTTYTPKATEECEELKSNIDYDGNISLYCECGNICQSGQTMCNVCLQKQEPVEISGNLYMSNNKGVIMYWVHLLNKELYCILLYNYRL